MLEKKGLLGNSGVTPTIELASNKSYTITLKNIAKEKRGIQ